MKPLTVKSLRKLCIKGVISPVEYWKYRKLKRKTYKSKTAFRRPFMLTEFTNEESLKNFRFSKYEILLLCEELKMPKCWKIPGGVRFTRVEGLCIMLRRLSYPNRLSDLVPMFHRDPGSISKIANFVINWIYSTYSPLVIRLRQNWLKPNVMLNMAESISESGAVYPNIIGFIDGTARPICRPKYNQKLLYSGYKKQHVIKYQSVVFPNGIIGRLDGPFLGRRHDSAILHLSRIKDEMSDLFVNSDGSWYTLYGDPGYANQKFIKVGFKNYGQMNANQKEFNAQMSALRVSVEYGFGKIVQQFAFLDFKKNQKIYLQNLKKQYVVAALLVNCQTCLRGDQISKYFNLIPPTLSEYLN